MLVLALWLLDDGAGAARESSTACCWVACSCVLASVGWALKEGGDDDVEDGESLALVDAAAVRALAWVALPLLLDGAYIHS